MTCSLLRRVNTYRRVDSDESTQQGIDSRAEINSPRKQKEIRCPARRTWPEPNRFLGAPYPAGYHRTTAATTTSYRVEWSS